MSTEHRPSANLYPGQAGPSPSGQYPASDSWEIRSQQNHERVPLDFVELVKGDYDIIMLGENHYHTAVMDSVAENASVLRDAGIRALLIEASSDQDFSDINGGEFARLDAGSVDIGPDLKLISPIKYARLGADPIAETRTNMIKTVTSFGIDIVPVDSARYHAYVRAPEDSSSRPETVTQEQREQDMAINIDEAVATYGKVAMLVGRAHARTGEHTNAYGKNFKETAQYAVEHGHSVRMVHFFGSEFYEGEARKPLPQLTENGWDKQRYMYRPPADDPIIIRERSSPDWIVYLPPNEFEFEYGASYLNEVPR